MALTKNLSLTQTLGAVFLCITILMISLSVTSLRGIERVGAQFNQLSEQALPFALNNAANRFTASASAMESAFLLLFIEEEMSAAQKYRQELKNRVAGLELAFDDFKEWYPEIKDYASLTAPMKWC